MVAGQAGEELLQPWRDALEIFDTLRQHPGVDQDLTDVVQAVSLRLLVQQVVSDRLVLGGEAARRRADALLRSQPRMLIEYSTVRSASRTGASCGAIVPLGRCRRSWRRSARTQRVQVPSA